MPVKYSKTPSLDPARFWPKVARGDGCWLWDGPMHGKTGYGQFNCDGSRCFAHRAAWILTHGPIPPGMFICHRCDTPRCVRPDHLFLGTQSDNMRDMHSKGRSVFQKHPEKLRRGDNHPARIDSSYLPRGDRHHARLHPGAVARGERSGHAKVTEEQVREMRRRHADRVGLGSLAREYGMSKSSVWAIIKRKSWAHIE